MTESETSQTRHLDLEPSKEYGIGVGVKLKEALHPDASWLITGRRPDDPEQGPTVSLIELDENGEPVGGEGGTPVTNIKENLGQLKTPDEVTEILVDTFEAQYGKTLSREVIIDMIRREQGVSSTR